MQYELSHDTIARQIYEKASVEARTRRKVEKFIRERYDREAILTEDDLDYIRPYLGQVNITTETQAYLQKGQRDLYLAKRRRTIITSGIILVLSIALAFAFYQNTQVKKQKEIAEKTAMALEYRNFDATQAFQFAQEACRLSEKQNLLAIKTCREILQSRHLLYQNSFNAHQDRLSEAIFSIDNQFIFSGDYDGLLIKQNAADSTILFSIPHPAAVIDLALSHDGKLLAMACQDKHLYLYDAKQGALIHKFPDHGAPLSQAVFSLDNQFLISANLMGHLKVWSLTDFSLVKESEHHSASIKSLKLSPDGKTIMSGGTKGILSLWEWQSDNPALIRQPIKSIILSICFHPDGKSYFTVGHNDPITQWDLTGDSIIASFPKTEAKVLSLSPSFDSQYLLSGLENGKALIWDLSSQKLLYTLAGQRESIHTVAFSDGNKLALSGGAKLQVWNLDQMIPKIVLQASTNNNLFNPKTHQLIEASEKELRTWDLSSANLANEPTWQSATLANEISSLAITPLGNHLMNANEGGDVTIWDLNKKIVYKQLLGAEGPFSLMDFKPTANRLVAYNEDDGILTIWDTQEDSILNSVEADWDVYALSISPDGKQVLLGDSEGPLWLYDIESDSTSNLLPDNEEEINQVFYHSFGERLIASLGSEVVAMDLTGQKLQTYDNPTTNSLYCLRYDRANNLLLGGTNKGDILIWDFDTAFLLQIIEGEQKGIYNLDVIKDLHIHDSQIFALHDNGNIKRYSSPIISKH
ncbi:MAG: hypothetical protein AB8H47_03255 [Bacteroidia bacterium]